MAMDMTPQPGDVSVTLPITFDYRGGRSQNKKVKIIVTIATIILSLIISIGIGTNAEMQLYMKFILIVVTLYVGLFILRFFVFRERYFSDIYEDLKEKDYALDTTDIWNIFDIEFDYPYICYFKNGYKGLFVKMEKDAITGKSSEAQYDHYEAISDAYNVAHSLNMNIIHIDYMDNVGNDPRLQKLYDDLNDVSNPDMQDMLIDIYTHLQDEMSGNYSSFDIYLFLTRDKIQNFIYNVQAVASTMLGGNFITYKILNRHEISGVCTALFNLHDFSLVDACENVISNNTHSGIIPIQVKHADGTVEEINKTSEEKRAIAREQERRKKEELAELERQKQIKKEKKKGTYKEKQISNESIDLFEFDEGDEVEVNLDTKEDNNSSNNDELDLFQ